MAKDEPNEATKRKVAVHFRLLDNSGLLTAAGRQALNPPKDKTKLTHNRTDSNISTSTDSGSGSFGFEFVEGAASIPQITLLYTWVAVNRKDELAEYLKSQQPSSDEDIEIVHINKHGEVIAGHNEEEPGDQEQLLEEVNAPKWKQLKEENNYSYTETARHMWALRQHSKSKLDDDGLAAEITKIHKARDERLKREAEIAEKKALKAASQAKRAAREANDARANARRASGDDDGAGDLELVVHTEYRPRGSSSSSTDTNNTSEGERATQVKGNKTAAKIS